MSDVYYPIEVVAKSPETFSGSLESSRLNRVGISHFSANAQIATRHRTAGVDDDEFAIVLPTRGKEFYEQRGRHGEVAPGGCLILSSGDGYRMEIPDQTQNVTLKIPADCLREIYPRIDSTCARGDIANSRFVPIVAQFALEGLRLSPQCSQEQRDRAEQVLLDLLYLMLDVPTGLDVAASQSVSDLLFQDLMNFIAWNFHIPSLSPEDAAKDRRVSTRYVHKLFKAHDTTFCRELLVARLHHAQKLLLDRQRGQSKMRTIAEVAYTCGFSSQSHFSIRYKDEFGRSPRDAGG